MLRSSGFGLLSSLKAVADGCQKGEIHSIYSHENTISMKEWRFSCYGFINHLLLNHHPKAYDTVVQFMYTNREQIPISIDNQPCPFHYAAFLTSLFNCREKYWDSFRDLKHILPGDILVYLPRDYTPKKIEEMPKGRTGMHMMIVEDVLNIDARRVDLKIIDCTRFRHCPEDTRARDGIGRAPLTIHLQSSGAELQWGSREKTWPKDLFFGRLKE